MRTSGAGGAEEDVRKLGQPEGWPRDRRAVGGAGYKKQAFRPLNRPAATGSERVRASGAGGVQLKETCAINASLTALGRVIAELVEAQRRGPAARHHVPYRDSRLTFLLQARPCGPTCSCMCACLAYSPAVAALWGKRLHQSTSMLAIPASWHFLGGCALDVRHFPCQILEQAYTCRMRRVKPDVCMQGAVLQRCPSSSSFNVGLHFISDQDCLGGNARTIIVAAVSPAAEHAGETRSTLEFAARAKCIRNRAVVNRDVRGSADALRRQLACLERCARCVRQMPCPGVRTCLRHAWGSWGPRWTLRQPPCTGTRGTLAQHAGVGGTLAEQAPA